MADIYIDIDGGIDEATYILEKALKIKPNDIVWYTLGRAYQKRKDFSMAIDCFHQALELNPKQALIWKALGNTYSLLNEYNTSIACYRNSLEINPDNICTKKNLDLALSRFNYLLFVQNEYLRFQICLQL